MISIAPASEFGGYRVSTAQNVIAMVTRPKFYGAFKANKERGMSDILWKNESPVEISVRGTKRG